MAQKIEEQFVITGPKKTFVEAYLIKDPKKSKAYNYWEILFLLILIVEFALIPYTMCTVVEEVLQVTQTIEIVIDILWLGHIMVSFTTAFYREGEPVTNIREISVKYLKENFIIDCLTTFPTLGTWYSIPSLYNFKILRLYYISRATAIIKTYIQ